MQSRGEDAMTVKEIRQTTGLSQQKFGEKFHIPVANITMWEQNRNKPLSYVVYMIEHILELEKEIEKLQKGQGNEDEKNAV